MKKLIVVVVIAAAVAVGYKFYKQKKKSNLPVYVPVTATRGDIKDIADTTGDVEPLNRVEVNPAVAGRVDKLLVEEGTKVKNGQLLAYISSTDRVAILDAAKARGEASLEKWANTYKPTPVLSPLDGTVIKRGVVQGQTVTTSSVMFALSDDLIVVAQVDESEIGRIKVGQRAEITLDAFPDKVTHGTVFQILHEGVTVSNVITYYVKIRPDHPVSYFKSEMTANIKIAVRSSKNAVLLPETAITEKDDGTRCVYKGNPMNPVLTPIKTGLDDGTNVEILSGVAEGETVYYSNSAYVPQNKEESSNPFMPSGPKSKKTSTKSKSSSSSKNSPPPPMG